MTKKLLNIQYLRAFSACAIVLFHAGSHFDTFIPIGQGRVALFFIVSGFVLWWITAGRTGGSTIFLARRLARLVPLYWLVTALTAVVSWFGFGSHGSVTWDHLLQSLLFIPHGGPIDGKIFPVYFPGWTLTYEMFFCLILTVLLMVPEPRRLWIITLGLSALSIAGMIFKPTGAILYTYTNVILLEFLSGVWLAALWNKISFSKGVAAAIFLGGFALSWVAEPISQHMPELFAAGIPALMIVLGALALEKTTVINIPWLKRVGDSAFSIYIWHWPVIGFAKVILVKAGITSVPLLLALTTIAGIAAGLILYPLIERPLTEWLMGHVDRYARAKRKVLASPGVVSTALLVGDTAVTPDAAG